MLELLLLPLIGTPKDTTAIQTLTEYSIVQVEVQEEIKPTPEPPKELTVQQKIDTNHYKCDEALYYIRADDATCLAKRVYTAPKAVNTTRTAVRPSKTASSGWFAWNQCTGYVASRRPVGQWNNASAWYWQAQRDGWSTGSTPRVGAIGQRNNHVVYVERVDGNRIYISERNYDYRGSYRERWANASDFRYIY